MHPPTNHDSFTFGPSFHSLNSRFDFACLLYAERLPISHFHLPLMHARGLCKRHLISLTDPYTSLLRVPQSPPSMSFPFALLHHVSIPRYYQYLCATISTFLHEHLHPFRFFPTFDSSMPHSVSCVIPATLFHLTPTYMFPSSLPPLASSLVSGSVLLVPTCNRHPCSISIRGVCRTPYRPFDRKILDSLY